MPAAVLAADVARLLDCQEREPVRRRPDPEFGAPFAAETKPPDIGTAKSAPTAAGSRSSPEVGKCRKCVVADAVGVEPVSTVKFPTCREICREFSLFPGNVD